MEKPKSLYKKAKEKVKNIASSVEVIYYWKIYFFQVKPIVNNAIFVIINKQIFSVLLFYNLKALIK